MFLGALLLALIVAVPVEAAGAGSSTPFTIVAFGDSLTAGPRLTTNETYPALLQKKLQSAHLAFTVVNAGITGDTTSRALARLDGALAVNPQIVIVELGVNDGLRGVPVPQVRANLEKIIEASQAKGAVVLLCAMEALPLNGWQYTLDFHRMYDELAEKYNVPLMPFLMNGVLGNPDLIGPDGVHPNAAGARVIADSIWEYLQPIAAKVAASGATVAPATTTTRDIR
jgi:acyl-CoA thioesterase-1